LSSIRQVTWLQGFIRLPRSAFARSFLRVEMGLPRLASESEQPDQQLLSLPGSASVEVTHAGGGNSVGGITRP
jgi:hypothetical protein